MATRRVFLKRVGGGLVAAGLPILSTPCAHAAGEDALPPTPGRPPARDPAVSASPGSHASGWKVWDGVTGTTGRQFNAGASIPWQNAGGDWLDATGAAQGPTAYATVVASSTGPLVFDVSALARKWSQSGNTGVFILAKGGGVQVGRRSNPDARLVPGLAIKLEDGTVLNAPCIASGVTDMSTYKGVTGTTGTLSTGTNMVLQFDFPRVAQKIAGATLTLQSIRVYGPCTLSAHELSVPPDWTATAPQQGLAAKYVRDANIDADPDVYFATTLTDAAQRKALFPEHHLTNSTVTMEPELGLPSLNVHYETRDFTPMVLDHRWSQKKNVTVRRNARNGLLLHEEIGAALYQQQQHPATPRELYFRYYLKLKSGYQCTVDGKKLPGLAGRYGKWNSVGYYQPDAGNGGSPTRGTYTPAHGYSGWSMRMLARVGVADDNPYAAQVVPMTYAYQAQMTGSYGDTWRWGSAASGYPMLEADRWYCVEQHVKVNTVVGPFDEHGNGTGLADGVLEAWIDGVKVFAKTDIVFRKHPAIAIDEVWLDHYHGGTTLPETEHAFAMTALVVAKRYIGPLGGVPAAAAAPAAPAGAGTMTVLATANQFASVNDRTSRLASSFRKIVDDFSGGVFNPYWGRNGCLVFHGGGHAATYDNSVVILDFDDDSFKRLSNASRENEAWTDASPDPLFDTVHCEYADGCPGSGHTYDTLAILPPEAGGGPRGSLIRVTSHAVHVKMSRDCGWSHRFDFATRAWSRYSVNALSGYLAPGAASAYDSRRSRFWWRAAPTSASGSIRYLDVATRQHNQIGIAKDLGFTSAPDSLVMNYDPHRDIVVATGSSGGQFRLAYLSCANPTTGWATANLSLAITARPGWQVPLAYVPKLRKWMLLAPDSNGRATGVYEVAVADDPVQTWDVSFRPFAGVTSVPAAYVAGKRWSYNAALASVVWQPGASTPTYLYRPAGV